MAISKIDSFVLKFKNLLLSKRNAVLKIESKAGIAEVTLQVKLGAPLPPHGQLQHVQHRGARDGPSRQRRRQRRAAAREAAAAIEAVKSGTRPVEETALENTITMKTSEAFDNKADEIHLSDELCDDKEQQQCFKG